MENLSVQVSEDVKEKLRDIAKREGINMSQVVRRMITDAAENGQEGTVYGALYMNEREGLRPWLEWLAANDQFFKAAAQRIELSDEFKKAYIEFVICLSGLCSGLVTASVEADRQKKSN